MKCELSACGECVECVIECVSVCECVSVGASSEVWSE